MFFAKEKNILVSLEKLSTFVNAFTVCKFCNKPIQVEEDNDKSVGLDCFLKIVCQNEKCLKSKINSSVNMSNEIGQFFEINYLCFFASIAGEKSELGYNSNNNNNNNNNDNNSNNNNNNKLGQSTY